MPQCCWNASRTRRPQRKTASTSASCTATNRRSRATEQGRRQRSGIRSTRLRRARRSGCGCVCHRPAGRAPPSTRVRCGPADRRARPMSSTGTVIPPRLTTKTDDRPARIRRPVVGQADLPLQVDNGSRRPRPAVAAAERADRRARNADLAPSRARRRHLHARRLGVPVVRRLGFGLSLRRARACRPGRGEEQLLLLCREWAMHPMANCPRTNGPSAT